MRSEQKATISELKGTDCRSRLKEQDSRIQKVSARVELQRPPSQTVANSYG